MAKARGRIERRRFLEKLPFVVECPIPGSGLRQRLDDMHAWARRTCGNERYGTSSRVDRSNSYAPAAILRVHFADEETARAFADAFTLPYPPPSSRPG
jgi:hypothetical protein